jgi:hypothetical protein
LLHLESRFYTDSLPFFFPTQNTTQFFVLTLFAWKWLAHIKWAAACIKTSDMIRGSTPARTTLHKQAERSPSREPSRIPHPLAMQRYFPLQDTALADLASACTWITDYCRYIDSINFRPF